MAEKVLKTKVALLYKTYSEWDLIKDTYLPLKGEVCFCSVPADTGAVQQEPAVLFKVGDGEHVFEELPWGSALAADIYSWAKKEHLDFNDLDESFLEELKEYVGGEEKDTIFRLAEDDNNVIKLQKSEDKGESWTVVENSAFIDLGAIDDEIATNAAAIAAEVARARAEEAKKVDREVVSGNNTSLIFNEADGGGAQITTATNKGFAGVHDGSNPDETYATMYVKNADGSQTLVRLDLNADGKAHYLKNGASASNDNEIATKLDVAQAGAAGIVDVLKVEAEEGYAATYEITQAGSKVGVSINIPKDFLVKRAELKEVEEEDVPYQGAHVGDKYIDFVVNSKDDEEEESHIYLPVNDLVDTYTGGKGIDISAGNEISFNANELDDDQIPQAKVNGLVDKLADLDIKDAELEQAIADEEDRAVAREDELEDKIDNLAISHVPAVIDNVFYANGNAVRITDDGTQNVAHYSIISGAEQTLSFPYNINVFAGGKGTAEKYANYDMGEIVVDGGKFSSIYGGSEGYGSVANTVLIFNDGNIRSGIIGGGKAGNANDINQVGKAVVKFNGGEALTVYGGAHGHGNVAECEVEINGGHAQYVTVAGSNGLTGIGKLVVKGGSIDVLQSVNRGYIEDAKVIIDGGEIEKMYAGGESGDSSVDGKAEKVNLQLLDGEIGQLFPGTYGGVEDASRCSGDFNAWAVNRAEAEACHLVENELILNCNL